MPLIREGRYATNDFSSRVVAARFPFGTVRIAASVSACLWIDSVRGAVFIPAGLAGRAPSQR